jgi:hypothetical protein
MDGACTTLALAARAAGLAAALLLAGSPAIEASGNERVPRFERYEAAFESAMAYVDPLHDLERFEARFVSPSGRVVTVPGFWDGGRVFRVRFSPDEEGAWSYETDASDTANAGLHGVRGGFTCTAAGRSEPIFRRGPLVRRKGAYHLAHADGTPFFYAACTAWNGALRSTDEEWEEYLAQRAASGYTAVQIVTTQWRGGASDANGEVAFDGAGRIRIRPSFFQRLDGKFDRVNAHGLVAAPVLLWALQTGQGRELSPGYYLPEPEAILLARYMVARYGAHHVLWILGGDGKYVGEYEQRWKTIGRGVFGGEHRGVVALHAQGRSWIGREYALEDWLDVVGYQTGHGDDRVAVEWTTKGPPAQDWHRLPARPTINMEPCYEQIAAGRIDAEDVRRASWRSLLATPVAGISYGANGVWPWLRTAGEPILNHRPGTGSSPWHEGIRLPGSVQVGRLARFVRELPWWTLRPAQELLAEQPGDAAFDAFVSAASSEDLRTILVYLPGPGRARLRLPLAGPYTLRWFDPVSGEYLPGSSAVSEPVAELRSPLPDDAVVVLTAPRESARAQAPRPGRTRAAPGASGGTMVE